MVNALGIRNALGLTLRNLGSYQHNHHTNIVIILKKLEKSGIKCDMLGEGGRIYTMERKSTFVSRRFFLAKSFSYSESAFGFVRL